MGSQRLPCERRRRLQRLQSSPRTDRSVRYLVRAELGVGGASFAHHQRRTGETFEGGSLRFPSGICRTASAMINRRTAGAPPGWRRGHRELGTRADADLRGPPRLKRRRGHVRYDRRARPSMRGRTGSHVDGPSATPLLRVWGYQVTGYFAPTSRYGTPDDLRYLVDVLHHRRRRDPRRVPAHFLNDPTGWRR